MATFLDNKIKIDFHVSTAQERIFTQLLYGPKIVSIESVSGIIRNVPVEPLTDEEKKSFRDN